MKYEIAFQVGGWPQSIFFSYSGNFAMYTLVTIRQILKSRNFWEYGSMLPCHQGKYFCQAAMSAGSCCFHQNDKSKYYCILSASSISFVHVCYTALHLLKTQGLCHDTAFNILNPTSPSRCHCCKYIEKKDTLQHSFQLKH